MSLSSVVEQWPLAVVAALTVALLVWARRMQETSNRRDRRHAAQQKHEDELAHRAGRGGEGGIPAVKLEVGNLPRDPEAGEQADSLVSTPPTTRVAVARSSGKTLRARYDEDRFLDVTVLQGPRGRFVLMDAVFDGHGGSFAADFLAANCARYMRNTLLRHPEASLEKLLEVGIGTLERDVLRELCWEDKLPHGAAGSVCLTEHDGEGSMKIACGNLGDCEVCVIDAEKHTMLSEVHRISNPAEKQRILDAGGVICDGSRVVHLVKFREPETGEEGDVTAYCAAGVAWEGKLSLSMQCTRSFGDFRWKHQAKGILNWSHVQAFVPRASPRWKDIERRVYSVVIGKPALNRLVLSEEQAGGYMLIGSDGFWDAFPDKNALRPFLFGDRSASADDVCAALVAAARQRIPDSLNSADDVTLVLVHLPTRFADHEQLMRPNLRRPLFGTMDDSEATEAAANK